MELGNHKRHGKTASHILKNQTQELENRMMEEL